MWDRVAGVIHGRPGAQRLAVTSGGTIPDRGYFGVFLASGASAGASPTRPAGPSPCAGPGPGSRSGSASSTRRWCTSRGSATCSCSAPRRGGSRTSPRTGCWCCPRPASRASCRSGTATRPGGRPSSARRSGPRSASSRRCPRRKAVASLRAGGLDELAARNLVRYLAEQRQATGHVPDDRTLVVERFRDELGDWRVVLHSPYGDRVHAPWALAISARLRERYGGMDVQALHTDDGIIIRVPDSDEPPPAGIALLDPDEIGEIITAEVGGSALFASRFRECAARALLLPRRQPGRRTPLWQQRQRSRAAAGDRVAVPRVPDHAGDRPGVPAGRVRRAGPDRGAARPRRPADTAGGGGDGRPEPVRAEPAVPLRRRVHVRGRRAAGRAAGAGARARPGAAGGAARHRGAARAARPGRGDRDRGRPAAPVGRPARPRRRGGGRPAAHVGAADRRGSGGPVRDAGVGRRVAGVARVGPADHRGAGGRAADVGGDRGRRAAAGRARGGAAGRHPRGVHRAAARPARRPGGAVGADARAVHRRRRWRRATGSGSRWWR